MPKIKGFTTKGKTSAQVLDELALAGAKYKLPFSASVELDVDKNPFRGSTIEVDGCDGKPQKIESKSFDSTFNTWHFSFKLFFIIIIQ